ncbi:MAG: exodeoxyribonuclease VII large subunit, partial [Chloroflexota bacterium]|nr:exodeoxyribonuclease VII large subunit [Chloroflexota bacterium]
LRCVLFNRKRLDIALQNGMAAVAHGRISIYEATGALQLYVDVIQPEGVGILHLEFERLKAKLEEEGLFDAARKRPLPQFPKRIGIVTSPDGAALHDIVNVITRRYPLVELVLAPTLVQGEAAPQGIVNALNALNDMDGIDVIIVARGGGSMEDLWAFNDERAARAIYASEAPVISGVGHDTDFTIADYVADRRAPTPSAAAELAVPYRVELEARLQSHIAAMAIAIAGKIDQSRQWADELSGAIAMHVKNAAAIDREKLRGQELKLDSLSPLATLERGYALVQHSKSGEGVSHISQVERGDTIEIKVSDGQFNGRVTGAKKGLQAWMKNFPSNKH